VKLTPSALMARKHSSRHHLRPRDLITHQANQTSKPKIILFFFLSKTFGKTFFGKGGGGGQTKHHNQKSFVFFLGKLLEKCFWKLLALPGQNMAWYGHGRPRHCRVTHWHSFAFPWYCIALALSWHGCCSQRHSLRCLFHGSPWHGHCNLCHCLGCPWHALARQPVACHGIAMAARGLPCLGSPWHALARQPVACHGIAMAACGLPCLGMA
jgi:hypothetical protein